MDVSRHKRVSRKPLTEAALNAITQSVERINDMNSQIASAVREQALVAEEANRNITSINDVTAQTVAGTGEVALASARLTNLASNMLTMVRQFQ